MLKIITITCTLMFCSLAQANMADDYYTISNVEITSMGPKTEASLLYETYNSPRFDFGSIIMAIDSLIAIGKKVWPIIEAGKPVLTTGGMLTSLSVLPDNNVGPRVTLVEMSNWSMPEVASYKVVYKNKLGASVVSFVFNVYFQYNGNHKGKGKYLTSITTEASHVSAAWGFDLDAKSELTSIANVGTLANPVASAIVKVGLVVKGKINSVQNSYSFYLDGKGNFKGLN